MIGSDNKTGDLTITKVNSNDGKSWKAEYTITAEDLGLVQWSINGSDRAGNSLELDQTQVTGISSLSFDRVSPAMKYEVFGSPPDVVSWSFSSSNNGYSDPARPSLLFLKAGDNATIAFVTERRIASPTDNDPPELKILNDAETEIYTATITEKSGSTDGTQWEAKFSIPANSDLETDLGFKLTYYDHYKNKHEIGFDDQRTATITGQTTIVPSKTFRIDTNEPALQQILIS